MVRAARLEASWLAIEADDEMTVHVTYSTDLFDAATVAGWIELYDELLAAVTARPDEPFSALSARLAAVERDRRRRRRERIKNDNQARLQGVRRRALVAAGRDGGEG